MKECNKDKECVELNIYVDCNELRPEPKPEPKGHCDCCDPCSGHHPDKKDEAEGCLKINVYVDCGKEKYTYKF
ncbi:MAG: hypothetical protein J1F11_02880 [Oscillospiraceae bacterium]|nr:hypothetical protein [Oscillospiraceae bacterium]